MVLAKGFSVHFFGQNDSFILIIMGDLGHCEGCHVTVATRDQNNLHGLFARIFGVDRLCIQQHCRERGHGEAGVRRAVRGGEGYCERDVGEPREIGLGELKARH